MFKTGLTFVRADFHLHTRKDKEFSFSGEDNSFVKDYVSALKDANISVGVITNHNKFDKLIPIKIVRNNLDKNTRK